MWQIFAKSSHTLIQMYKMIYRDTYKQGSKLLGTTLKPIVIYNRTQFLKMGHPRALFRLFRSFQTNINTILQQISVKKCPFKIWHQNSNPRPLEHESPPITTRQFDQRKQSYFCHVLFLSPIRNNNSNDEARLNDNQIKICFDIKKKNNLKNMFFLKYKFICALEAIKILINPSRTSIHFLGCSFHFLGCS